MTNTNQIDILVFLCYISRPQVISKFNAKKKPRGVPFPHKLLQGILWHLAYI